MRVFVSVCMYVLYACMLTYIHVCTNLIASLTDAIYIHDVLFMYSTCVVMYILYERNIGAKKYFIKV